MGKKGGSRHLKREPAARFWPLHRKEFAWAPKPVPGPHPADRCLPLTVILRDASRLAGTAREAEIALSRAKVKVDGKVRREGKFPTGLMDVVEIPDAGLTFRILPTRGKELGLVRIPKDEARFKLCKIEGKTTLKGGLVQLNLHDGRNIVINVSDPKKTVEDHFKVNDTLRISIPSQRVLGHIKFTEGAYALLISGKNLGKHGRIVKIEKGTFARKPMVSIQDKDGEILQTVAENVFVIGESEPLIRLE